MPIFKHKIASPGKYQVGDRIIDVDMGLLQHWADTAQEWLKSDLSIPVPNGHTSDPEANRGWVKNIWLDGEWLMGEFDLDEPIKSGVSLSSPVKYMDGRGKEWQHPITHVALTTEPVIPNGDFYMSLDTSVGKNNYGTGEDEIVSNVESDMIDKIKKMFGINDDEKLELAIKETADSVISTAFEQRKSKIESIDWLTPAGKSKLFEKFANSEVNLSLQDTRLADTQLDFILSLAEHRVVPAINVPEQVDGNDKSDTIESLKTQLYTRN